jgi:psiF repeat
MKKFVAAVLLSIPFIAGNAFAQDAPAKAAKPAKQTKLGTCSKEAKAQGLKGAERKAYIKSCTKKKA